MKAGVERLATFEFIAQIIAMDMEYVIFRIKQRGVFAMHRSLAQTVA
jgi:hypothetical protein